MNQAPVGPGHVSIGGDFARVFDPEDYLAMVNSLDEATVVLRAHLVLEDFLNIWASRVTSTEDLFGGIFVPFKTKLFICKNLGFDDRFASALNKINEIRNRYSHKRKYKIEDSGMASLRDAVDALPAEQGFTQCDEFELYLEGAGPDGERKQVSYNWMTADTKKRLAIVQVILVLKLVQWMQNAFNDRGIKYNLVAWPATVD